MIADTEMQSMQELYPCLVGVSTAIFARRCYKCKKVYFVNQKDPNYKCNACQEKEQREKEQQEKDKEADKILNKK